MVQEFDLLGPTGPLPHLEGISLRLDYHLLSLTQSLSFGAIYAYCFHIKDMHNFYMKILCLFFDRPSSCRIKREETAVEANNCLEDAISL